VRDSERRVKDWVAGLTDRLSKVADRIDWLIRHMAASADTSSAYWSQMNKEFRWNYEKARKIISEWANVTIPEQFNTALKEQIRRIKGRSLELPKQVDFSTFSRTHLNKQSLRSVLDETMAAFNTGLRSGEMTLRRLSSMTQQLNVTETQLNRAVAEGFAEAGSSMGAKRRLQAALMKKALDGQYITVVDKNGNPRQYRVDTYAELVARTKLMEASSQAVLSTAISTGADLVQVSTHNTLCAICAPFEGKIYSLSGSDPDLPALEEEPPYHPNCCLPGTRMISPGGIVAGQRAVYRGQAIELSFAQCGRLSVTVNHMLLAPDGFVPAHMLRKGDDIFYCPGFERIISGYPYDNGSPSVAEKIFGSLLESRGMEFRRMPVSAEDVHGDGRSIDRYIDIVRPDGFLRNASESMFFKHGEGQLLDPGDPDTPLFVGERDFASMLKTLALSADRIMGGLRSGSLDFRGKPGSVNRFHIGEGSKLHSGLQKTIADNQPMHIESFRDFAHQQSAFIQTDKLIDIKVVPYHGYVYDLHSFSSLYLANGILTSNCQHSLSVVFREALARDGTLDRYIEFSNDETDIHPTRRGWIPVSERKLA
jgi:hypothetical protein